MDKSNRSIYVVGRATHYACWMQGKLVYNMEDADVVVFTGGEDVSPELYKAQPHPTTTSNRWRDDDEIEEFRLARELNKPIIGICRGAQFLCVMAGGKLVQDQGQDGSYHEMLTNEGKVVMVSSCHHQAQYPWILPANQFKILGWTVGQSDYHFGESDDEELVIGKVAGNIEIEECYYPGINALCLQHHPEFAISAYHSSHNAKTYIDHCRNLLNKLLDGTV